ncbi:MAG: hypothetical protein WCX82_00010 [archaeon]|jgi:hypothetical protein
MKLAPIKLRSKKGQAAITDALFFLLVIVTLSVLMFRYSSTYGTRINQATSDLYYKEYTNSVLKTIFYTSVPLNYSLDLNSSLETDYLMTQVKQNYYANGKIGESDINSLNIGTPGAPDYRDLAKFNLFHTVKATMIPLSSHDYVFYLYNDENDSFAYFMIKNTNFNPVELNSNAPRNATARGIVNYTNSIPNYYLCNPNGYADIRDVISRSPKIFSSSVPLSFQQYTEIGNNVSYPKSTVIATFAIWPATVDINSIMLEEQLNCKIVD